MKSRKLAQNTVIVMAAFGAQRVLALGRDWVVGHRFGAGYEYDAFVAAVQGPELLFTLIAGGALLAAFIPVFSEQLAKGPREDTWRLASAVGNVVVLALLTIGLVAGLHAESITANWLVPEFEAEKQALTAELLRIILVQTFIFGASGVVVGVLHAHQHFFLPAIAPVFYTVGQILGAVVLAPRMGISGLTWGMVLGAAGYLLVQVPALWRFGARYIPTLGLDMPGLRRIYRLMVPRLVSLGLVELADVFFVRLGSRLPNGHLSAYFWSWRLMQLPETLFGTAVAQVFFPTLCELASAGDYEVFRQRATGALRVILTLTVPSAVGLILLGRPLMSLIGGAFDARAVELVHAALVIMSVRLVAEAAMEIGARLFYAQQDTVTPMFTAGVGQSVSIGLAYALIEPLGYRGLAIATTAGFWIETSLLLTLAHRRIGGIVDRGMLGAAGRAVVGSGVLGLGVWGAQLALPATDGRLEVAAAVVVAVLAGLVGYLATLVALQSPELRAIPALLSKYKGVE